MERGGREGEREAISPLRGRRHENQSRTLRTPLLPMSPLFSACADRQNRRATVFLAFSTWTKSITLNDYVYTPSSGLNWIPCLVDPLTNQNRMHFEQFPGGGSAFAWRGPDSVFKRDWIFSSSLHIFRGSIHPLGGFSPAPAPKTRRRRRLHPTFADP